MMNLEKSQKKLESKYACNKCRDKEYILTPNDEVKWCECREIRLSKERIVKSGLSDRFEKNNFNNYKANNIQRRDAVIKCSKYIKSFDGKKSLMLSGQVGSGKTHLAIATSKSLLNKVGVRYTSYVSELSKLVFNQLDQEYYQKKMDEFRNPTVLFIDDLFKGNVTAAERKIAYDIINWRYDNKKAMIITTELNRMQLCDIDEALASRIIEMCYDEEQEDEHIIEFNGRELNYRLFKK